MRKNIIGLTALVMFLAMVMPSALGATYDCNNCSSCEGYLQNSTSGDVIQLTADINDQVGSCINYINDNVTFDCQNHLIDADGSGQSPDIGINASGDNIVIRNCRVNDRFDNYLVYIVNSDNVTLSNVTSLGGASRTSIFTSGLTNSTFQDVTTNGRFDVSCSYCHFDGGSHENTGNPSLDLSGSFNLFENSVVRGTSNLLLGNDWYFKNVTFRNGGNGLQWVSTRNNLTIDGCNFSGNTYGFYTTQPSQTNLTIKNSNFTGNTYGIYSTNPYASNNWLVYNNYFDNPQDVAFTHPTFLITVDWSIIPEFGVNILGGPFIGGNYWANSQGNFTDPDGDGIGTPFNVSGNFSTVYGDQIDEAPLMTAQPSACDSCSSCDSAIDGASVNDIIFLNASILNSGAQPCIDMDNTNNNITFNCYGNILDGIDSGSSGSRGFYLHGNPPPADNVIKNCVMTDWYDAIYIDRATRTIIENATITSNVQHGIYHGGTGSGDIYRNSVISNNAYAVEFQNTGNCVVENNTMTGNTHAIHLFWDANNINITRNNITGSSQTGIWLDEQFGSASPYDNLIWDNYIDNPSATNGNVRNEAIEPNYFNVTLQAGTNIIGGSWIGGNYWGDYSGWDTSGNGVGETAYLIDNATVGAVDGYDYLPITDRQDLYPPELTITLPTNTTYIVVDIDLNYTATDNVSGVDSCWYSVNGSANTTISGCNNITIPLVDGFFHLEVWVNDSAGWESTQDVYFSIDSTVPSITIYSPQATSYGELPIELRVSASEAVDTWYYNINGTNVTFTPNTTLPFTGVGDAGNYNLDVWVNDTAGLWGKSTVAFSFNPYFLANNPFFLIIPIGLALVSLSLLASALLDQKRQLDINKVIGAGVLMVIVIVMLGVMFGVTI